MTPAFWKRRGATFFENEETCLSSGALRRGRRLQLASTYCERRLALSCFHSLAEPLAIVVADRVGREMFS